MVEQKFKTEDDFRKYLDEAIKKSEKDTPQYLTCEIMLDGYLTTQMGQAIFSLMCDWEGFAKPYLRAIRKTLNEPTEIKEGNLEDQLNNDPNLRKKVEHDLKISSVYNNEGKVIKEAIDFLHNEFSDPFIQIAIAYRALREIDEKNYGSLMKREGTDLIGSIEELTKDHRMALHLFYTSVARRIIRLYLDPVDQVSIER